MIRSIKRFFEQNIDEGSTQAALSEHALQLAAAALLLEVGRADYSMTNEELNEITDALQSAFQLSDLETSTLLDLANEQSKVATSLHGFTSLINRHLSLEQRIKVVELMWQVAYADDRLDKHENHLLRKTAGLLYIPHKQFISAKLRAKKIMAAQQNTS